MLVGTQEEEDPSDNRDAASGLWSFASPTPPLKKKKSRQTKSNDLAGIWLCSSSAGDASFS